MPEDGSGTEGGLGTVDQDGGGAFYIKEERSGCSTAGTESPGTGGPTGGGYSSFPDSQEPVDARKALDRIKNTHHSDRILGEDGKGVEDNARSYQQPKSGISI